MSYTYYTGCSCYGQQWYRPTCPVHPTVQTSITFSTYRVCAGRHCAHDAQCNKFFTRNGG